MRNILNRFKDSCFDEKFLAHPKNYIFQCLLIFVCISIVMLLYSFFGGIIVASLGASSFIVFITPQKEGSRFRYVVGGYVCGAVSGVLFALLRSTVAGFELGGSEYMQTVISAAAAATAIFIMVVMNFEHPPAAALALGLSADPQYIKTALAAIAGVLVICTIRRALRKNLRDLI